MGSVGVTEACTGGEGTNKWSGACCQERRIYPLGSQRSLKSLTFELDLKNRITIVGREKETTKQRNAMASLEQTGAGND